MATSLLIIIIMITRCESLIVIVPTNIFLDTVPFKILFDYSSAPPARMGEWLMINDHNHEHDITLATDCSLKPERFCLFKHDLPYTVELSAGGWMSY